MWLNGKIKVFIDLTTYCNAACPQCHRTNPNTLHKADWLPLIQWTLDDFKQAYDTDTLNKISVFDICGTWGDPAMNKDLLPIVQYIIDNSDSVVKIHTNGSLRDETFWWDLCVVGGERLSICFAVDGIDQDMHAFYRRKTNLSTVLKHINICSLTRATVNTKTIVFKHNEDYLDEIEAMCRSAGSQSHDRTISDRFGRNGDNKFEYNDEHGDMQVLEISSL